MYTKEELKKIQAALPITVSNGYDLIKAKLPYLSKVQISLVFTNPKRFKPEVIDAAFEVINEHKEYLEAQRKKIDSL